MDAGFHMVRILKCVLICAGFHVLSALADQPAGKIGVTRLDVTKTQDEVSSELPLVQAIGLLGHKTGYELQLFTQKDWETLPVHTNFTEGTDIDKAIKQLLKNFDYAAIREQPGRIAIYVYGVTGDNENAPMLTREMAERLQQYNSKKIENFEYIPSDDGTPNLARTRPTTLEDIPYDTSTLEILPPGEDGQPSITWADYRINENANKEMRYDYFERVPPDNFGDDSEKH